VRRARDVVAWKQDHGIVAADMPIKIDLRIDALDRGDNERKAWLAGQRCKHEEFSQDPLYGFALA
jgi:hypothetical protein